MINANRLPQTAAHSTFFAEAFEKATVRTATATEHILIEHSAKTHDHVAADSSDDRGRLECKTPHAQRSSKRHHANTVGCHTRGRGHTIFATKQMNVMTQIAKPLGCSVKIPLGSTLEIEAFMRQRDFHVCEL
jgi:hypothetical protein